MRSCTAIKKSLVCSVPGQGLSTQTLEKPRWDMLNKRELVKLDVEVARLKARLGQTDGLLGTLLIANPFDILSLHGPMISKSEMRKIHGVSVNVLLLHFPNIFQTRTAQRATYFVLLHSLLTYCYISEKYKAKLRTFDF